MAGARTAQIARGEALGREAGWYRFRDLVGSRDVCTIDVGLPRLNSEDRSRWLIAIDRLPGPVGPLDLATVLVADGLSEPAGAPTEAAERVLETCEVVVVGPDGLESLDAASRDWFASFYAVDDRTTAGPDASPHRPVVWVRRGP